MSRRHIFAVLAAGISLVAAGCIDLEYIGQEFEPTPQSRPVALFQNRAEVPPGEYRIIGRATLTAPDGTLGYDIQEKLLDSAREAGADAVCLISTERIHVGTYTIVNSDFSPPGSVRLNPGNLSADGSFRAVNTFGSEVTSVRGEERSRVEIEVKALFLKNRVELARILAERGRELEELESTGEPARPETEMTTEETSEKRASAEADKTTEVPIPDLTPADGTRDRAKVVPVAPPAIPETPDRAVNSVSAKE